MIFKVFAKQDLPLLYDMLAANIVIGPVEKGRKQDGSVIYDFDVVYDFSDLRLDYTTTVNSAKKYFLPYRQKLCSFSMHDGLWEKRVDYDPDGSLVFFGFHACDINALNKLDKVLLSSRYPNPFYAGRRQSMFIIGVDCVPQPFCFCRSMGTDTVLQGFDLFLTDLGDKYFAEILTVKAFNILKEVGFREPDADDHARFLEIVGYREKLFTTHVDTTDLTKILDLEFSSDAWETWGKKCLSCGTCANVCPTCYCYDVRETVALDLASAEKNMHLYSCNLVDFAEVAGGHNFRPLSQTRLKYRYYHKHRGFVEAFEEALCVGCGRCGEACLAGITVPRVISSVRGKEAP